MSYPTANQRERWENRADRHDMNMSEFVQLMVEAGMKADDGFAISVEADESVRELRRQRNELRTELERERERVQELEEQAYTSELTIVEEYVAENPGCTLSDILDRLSETLPVRLNGYLDAANIEGREDEEPPAYYPGDSE